MAKKVVKKKKKVESKLAARKARRSSPEDRMVGESTTTPSSLAPPVEEIVISDPLPVVEVEMVKCRYCGAPMPKPSDGSTFYTDNCVTTGEPVFDEVGRRIA